jgi:LPXTG-site transpeptidase (sortase) family protein
VALLALLCVALAAIACGGGGDDNGDATEEPSAAVTELAPNESAGLKTPIATSPGDELTAFDLAQRGAGTPPRGEFTGDRLIIPKINVDAPFTYKIVGVDGQMPNPEGPTDVAYYDFQNWPGMGGLPGKGGNVVVAGHVDYIRYGPAVFWDLHTLGVGDRVQIRLKDGSVVEYAIELNKHIADEKATAEELWKDIVASTKDESITLITCTGQFSAGHYSDRQILWGRRVT